MVLKLIRIAFIIFIAVIIILIISKSNSTELKYKITPDKILNKIEVQAFLDTIAYAEGTFNENGYNYLYGGHIFKDFSDHPRCIIGSRSYPFIQKITQKDKNLLSTAAGKYQIVESTCIQKVKQKSKNLLSTAAGRYQILESTWDKIVSKIHLKDFSPINQDRAAIELINQEEALEDVIKGNFESAIKKVANVWASLPGSPYGQPIIPIEKLKNFYLKQINLYKAAKIKKS